jgi:hypothetical protein
MPSTIANSPTKNRVIEWPFEMRIVLAPAGFVLREQSSNETTLLLRQKSSTNLDGYSRRAAEWYERMRKIVKVKRCFLASLIICVERFEAAKWSLGEPSVREIMQRRPR